MPCCITATKLGSVESYKKFVNCFQNFKDLKKYKDAMQSIGLLLTVDNRLRFLSDGKEIIKSSSWKLFPKSEHHFLNDCIKNGHVLIEYLFKASPENYDPIIKSIFQCNLPLSWSNEVKAPQEWPIEKISNVIKCVNEDKTFQEYKKQLFRDFTLIPSNLNTMFSTASELLPMKTLQMIKNTSEWYMELTRHKKLHKNIENHKELLSELNMPFVVEDEHLYNKTVLSALPSISDPSDTLRCLRWLVEENYENFKSKFENKSNFQTVFEILCQVSFSSSVNQEHIKRIPVFTTIENDLISLPPDENLYDPKVII